MIHCINCIWAFGCLDLDTDDYLNQQVEECKNYIDYRELIKQKKNNMTVQELINQLHKIEDKSKEVRYAMLDNTDELKDCYSVYRFNQVTINSDKIWLKYV